jgi:hypothetical protein
LQSPPDLALVDVADALAGCARERSSSNWSSEQPPPMLGILLRAPWQAIRARIHAELVAAGFSDVRPRDLAVLQWPGPDGMRAIDVAANASMSKQAVKR